MAKIVLMASTRSAAHQYILLVNIIVTTCRPMLFITGECDIVMRSSRLSVCLSV